MRLILLCLGLLTALPIMAAPELKGTPEELRSFLEPRQQTVSLYGKSTVTAYTDIADITLVVTTQDKNLATALEQNQQLRNNLAQSFVAAGINIDSIKSAKFSSSPQYGWFGKAPSSYEVVNRVQVSIDSAKHIQLLATASDKHDEVTFGGAKFRHSEKDSSKTKAQQQALDDVLAQRSRYEKQLSLKLTPINFHYGPVQLRTANLRPRKASMDLQMESSAAFAAAPVELPTSFDEVKYEASVQVTFKVES